MNLEEYLSDINPELLTISEGRIELTKFDPLLFALLYLPHHLKNSNNELTLSNIEVTPKNTLSYFMSTIISDDLIPKTHTT